MSKKFKKIKTNNKSEIYENDEYIVKVSDIPGFFYKKNGTDFTDYDSELGDDDYKFVEAVKLEITNKATNKKSQKRCYQGYSVIDDLQRDINTDKSQFADILKKIDKS